MNQIVQTKKSAGTLKLIGGALCLDFTNTADWHGTDHPLEWLTSYADLVLWSKHASILTELEAQHLLEQAKDRPESAGAVLKRAITLREAIYRIFKAVVKGLSPNADDLVVLNDELSKALSRLRIALKENSFVWSRIHGEDALDKMLWPVAQSAADLLTSSKLNRLRRCSDENCSWLFLDMSRNRSRRWCVMEDCGNRAKARRYYQRKRAAHC